MTNKKAAKKSVKAAKPSVKKAEKPPKAVAKKVAKPAVKKAIETKSEWVPKPGCTNLQLAETIQKCLVDIDAKVVFAESCTGGEISSTMAKLPGISKVLCGCFVTYRPASKKAWIGVNRKTIKSHSTESIEVAREMAAGALKMTPEASWSLSIVGHVGPGVLPDVDGKIYICVMRKTNKGNFKIADELCYTILGVEERVARQKMATEISLTLLVRTLMKRTTGDLRKKVLEEA